MERLDDHEALYASSMAPSNPPSQAPPQPLTRGIAKEPSGDSAQGLDLGGCDSTGPAASTSPGEPTQVQQAWQRLTAPEGDTTAPAERQSGGGKLTAVRRAAAVAVIVLCAVGFFATRVVDSLTVCTIVETSEWLSFKSVKSCNPLPVQDVVPGLLLALALLWPDLASFELAGIGRIQRRLEGQEVRQDALESQQNLLMQTVASSAASAKSEMHLNLTHPDLAAVVGRLAKLETKISDDARQSSSSADHALPELASDSADEPNSEPSPHPVGRPKRNESITSPSDQLVAQTRDLWPWLEYVRRLGDRRFVENAASWAEGTDLAALSLPAADQKILGAVERAAGQRVHPERVRDWDSRRQLEIQMLRQNLEKGPALEERAANIAAGVADELRGELKATGLINSPAPAS